MTMIDEIKQFSSLELSNLFLYTILYDVSSSKSSVINWKGYTLKHSAEVSTKKKE